MAEMTERLKRVIAPIAEKEANPVATVAGGQVMGLARDGVATYRGVPFAAPPVGPLRFLPPRPPKPWKGVLDCTRFRESAIPAAEIDPLIARGEDCLYLNIWAPQDAAGAKLPVLVFIHGGGYADGSPAKLIFDGTRFAKDGVVQVNVSYRLNALGFLALPEVEAKYGALGNAGTLDQIAALQWVRDNIAAFGGDPDCVTVCGESAGAFSVSNLLLSPLAKGLFCRAVMESGNVLGQPIMAPASQGGRRQALLQSRAFRAAFGARTLPELQKLDAHKLAKASPFVNDMTAAGHYCFWPVFDGAVIPEDPYQALVQGRVNGVDIMAGYNTDEGTLFVPRGTSEEAYIKLLWRIFGENALEVLEQYPVNKRHTAAARALRLAEMGLAMGGDIFADELSRQGHNVWYYNFNYSMPVLEQVGLGAMHALELIYVFDTVPKLLVRDEATAAFKESVHNRWLNFITNGDPNQGQPAGPTWPRYTPEGKETMVLDLESRPAPSPHAKEAAFYRDILWAKEKPTV